MSHWTLLSLVLVLSSCDFAGDDVLEFNSIDSLSYFREIESTSKFNALFNKQLNGNIELSSNGKTEASEWKTYESNDQQLRFSIPSDWEIVYKEGYLLYCKIEGSRESFFVCLAHRKDEVNIDIDEYVSVVIESSLSDTLEVFRLNQLSLRTSKSRSSYYLQMDSEKEEEEKKYYGFFTENEHFIFDLSYCVTGEQSNGFSDVYFMGALQSFQINGTPVLNSKAIITELDTTLY